MIPEGAYVTESEEIETSLYLKCITSPGALFSPETHCIHQSKLVVPQSRPDNSLSFVTVFRYFRRQELGLVSVHCSRSGVIGTGFLRLGIW